MLDQSSYIEGEFSGPVPPLLSAKLALQDGDSQPQSGDITPQKKNYVQKFKSLKTIGYNVQNKSKDVQSIFENEEVQYGSKPQFLKLILAKSITNNFINNLKNRSYIRKLNQLTHFQISQLDDLQLEMEDEDDKGRLLLGIFDVFTPYSKFIVIWGVFQIITYVLIFFWLPFKISFDLKAINQLVDEQNLDQYVELILMTILLFDIAVGLNLGFVYKGHLIKDRKKVLLNYFNQNAFVDLSLLCLIFYILRVTKINKILAQIQEFFNLSGLLNDIVGLLKVLMVILGIVHIFGCIWHGIAFYNTQYSWLDAYNLKDKAIASKYNIAIYWATMTMTTVGYGDITAKNDTEYLINNITMFLGSIVFAYSVNSIGIFVSNMYKGTIEYSRIVTLINTFMSKNKINFQLQTRIRSYLEYILQEESETNDDEVEVIVNKLSKHLQDELQYQLRINILKYFNVFANQFSDSLLKNLLHYMEEQAFSPEEQIIQCNQLDDCSLYIITKGEVEIVFESTVVNKKVIRNRVANLKQQDTFGQISFFTGQPRNATIISKGFTRVYKIKRDNLLQILYSFPNDLERFCDIRDKLMQGDYNALQLQCFSCQSSNHLVNECNYIHFVPDKEKIIKKEYYPFQQVRQERFQRTFRGKSINAIMNQELYYEKAQHLMDDINHFKNQDEIESQTNQNYDEDEYEDENIESQSINLKSISGSILHKGENEEESSKELHTQSYLRKNQQPKSTIQTAGFGILQNKTQATYDEPNSSEDEDEKMDQVIILPQKIQSNQKPQQKKILRSASNDDHQVLKRPSVDHKLLTLKKYQQKSDIEISYNKQVIPTVSRKSTTINPTIINDNTLILNGQSMQSVGINILNFEKMQTFQIYNPLYNYDVVIKRFAKIQKLFGKKRLYPENSLYSFFFITIKKGWKLRRLGKLNDVKTPNMLKSTKRIKEGRILTNSKSNNNLLRQLT